MPESGADTSAEDGRDVSGWAAAGSHEKLDNHSASSNRKREKGRFDSRYMTVPLELFYSIRRTFLCHNLAFLYQRRLKK